MHHFLRVLQRSTVSEQPMKIAVIPLAPACTHDSRLVYRQDQHNVSVPVSESHDN